MGRRQYNIGNKQQLRLVLHGWITPINSSNYRLRHNYVKRAEQLTPPFVKSLKLRRLD